MIFSCKRLSFLFSFLPPPAFCGFTLPSSFCVCLPSFHEQHQSAAKRDFNVSCCCSILQGNKKMQTCKIIHFLKQFSCLHCCSLGFETVIWNIFLENLVLKDSVFFHHSKTFYCHPGQFDSWKHLCLLNDICNLFEKGRMGHPTLSASNSFLHLLRNWMFSTK